VARKRLVQFAYEKKREKPESIFEGIIKAGMPDVLGSSESSSTHSSKKRARFIKNPGTGEWMSPLEARRYVGADIERYLGRKPTKKELNQAWSEMGKHTKRNLPSHEGQIIERAGKRPIVIGKL
jgi:hypothetical protein